MKNQLKQTIIGFSYAVGVALLSYSGIILNINFWPWPAIVLGVLWFIPTVLHLTIVWRVMARDRREGRVVLYNMFSLSPFGAIAAIFGIMCAIWALPALIIYWRLNPEYPKRAIKICALLVSLSFSILYFLANREKFPNVADKVTFFTGIILGPVGILEILI